MWGKGGVEGQIGWFRHNHLVPDVPSIAALNTLVDEWDAADEARRIGGRARTVREFLEIERPPRSAVSTPPPAPRTAGTAPRSPPPRNPSPPPAIT